MLVLEIQSLLSKTKLGSQMFRYFLAKSELASYHSCGSFPRFGNILKVLPSSLFEPRLQSIRGLSKYSSPSFVIKRYYAYII